MLRTIIALSLMIAGNAHASKFFSYCTLTDLQPTPINIYISSIFETEEKIESKNSTKELSFIEQLRSRYDLSENTTSSCSSGFTDPFKPQLEIMNMLSKLQQSLGDNGFKSKIVSFEF